MRAPCKLDKPSSQPRGLCVKDPPLRHIANPIPLRYTDPPLQPLLNDPPSTHTPPLSVPQMYPFPGELPEFSLGTRGLFRSPVSVSVTSACPREACGFCCGCFRLSVVPPSMSVYNIFFSLDNLFIQFVGFTLGIVISVVCANLGFLDL